MSTLPHFRPPLWPDAVPGARFASLVRRSPEGCRVALIGLADDLGVRLNGGRPGARDGPSAFRAALAGYGVSDPEGWEWPTVFDAGDVIAAEGNDAVTLDVTHRRAQDAVAAILDLGLLPVAIGGGHDLTLSVARALASRGGEISAVSFDPHLDVRETPGSGMAFRRIFEERLAKRVVIHGMNPMVNSKDHAAYFRAKGGIVAPPEAEATFEGPRVLVSFDLDVLDASSAPGVSALNPCGWSVARAERAVLAAGRYPGVAAFDIMELNPARDEQGRTARVAAHLFLTFLRGLAGRPA